MCSWSNCRRRYEKPVELVGWKISTASTNYRVQAQFRALAGLGDQMGQAFLREWPTMKPLLDAANHAILGHGFEQVKAERVQQLYDVVLKLSGVSEMSLPKFPVLNV